MIIAAPSVPHTGHNFVCKRILKNYPLYSASVTPAEMYTKQKKLAIADHYWPNTIENWKYYLEHYPTIVSLRHPARCLLSHELRNTIHANIERFRMHWVNMMELIPYANEVYYLHLDDYDIREAQAAKIMRVVGEEFEIDWSVSAETGSKKNTEQAEITAELLEKIPQEFIEFYEKAKTQ